MLERRHLLRLKPTFVTLLIVCVTGILLQQLFAPGVSMQNPIEVLAVAAPTTVVAGERTAIYGGLMIHDYRDQVLFRVCANRTPCIVERVLTTFPGENWDWFGAIPASATQGAYLAELIVRRPNGLGHYRTYALHQWTVLVE